MRQIKPPLPPQKSRSKRSLRRFTFLPSWNHRFVDIFSQDEQGEWLIDLGNFHDADSLEEI
jgi:hypothetical protein